MAKTVLFAGGIEAFTSSATARFTPFATTYIGSDLFSSSSVEIEYQNAGTLSDFSVVVYANNRSGVASSTSGPYINGSASAVTVSIPIATTGRFTDSTNTASVAANDDLSLGTHPQNGGGGAVQLGNWLCVFDQTTGSHFRPASYSNGTAVGVGTTYPPIVSGASTSRFPTTESSYTINGIAGTASYLAARSGSNSRNGDVVITFRKNAADGSGTVTVPSSTTGNFVDTTNSDSIADGDDINYKCVRGGTTGTVTLQSISVNYAGTDDAFMALACGDAAFSPSAATDYFFHLAGLLETTYTDALTKQLWPLDGFEASRNEIVIPTNNITLDSALYFRKNGADTTLVIIIPNETTGRFVNNTDTVQIDDGDEINYRLMTDEAGNITVRQIGIKFAPVAEEGNIGELPASVIELEGFAPSSATTEDHFANAPASTIELEGQTPSAAITEDHFANAPASTIELEGFNPSAQTGDSNAGELPASTIELEGFAPTAETTETDPNHTANLPASAINLLSFAPQSVTTGDQIIGNLDCAIVELDALDVEVVELDALNVSVFVIQ